MAARRDYTLYVSLSDAEREQVQTAADGAGLSLSSFARSATLKAVRQETNVVERGRPKMPADGWKR